LTSSHPRPDLLVKDERFGKGPRGQNFVLSHTDENSLQPLHGALHLQGNQQRSFFFL
jgi:hypothetical protein